MATIGHDTLFIKPAPGNPRNSEGSFLRLNDGSIMFAYSRYLGESWNDHAYAEIYAIFSRDDGETWGEGRTIIRCNPGESNVMSVSMMRMANGDVGLFFLRKTTDEDCRLNLIRSSDEGKTWSDYEILIPNPGYYVTNNDRVIRLKNGRIIFPANLYVGSENVYNVKGHSIAIFFISDDDGHTFREAKEHLRLPFEKTDTGLQETGLLELDDGRLWAWSRTGHGYQFEAFSTDGGDTWSDVNPNPFFSSPGSPMCVRRLEDNSMFAVFNPIPNYNGRETYISWGRTPLVCTISTTDTDSFGELKMIEDDPRYGYCYTAIFPTDKYILLGYCCGWEGHQTLESLKIKKIMLDELK